MSEQKMSISFRVDDVMHLDESTPHLHMDFVPVASRNKMNDSGDFDRKTYVSVLETTVAIKQFRLTPRKIYPKKIYSYYNDENIKYLAEQLKTISEFSFTSSESIYAKAQELQRTIRELQAQNKDTQSVQAQLQRVK